MRGTHVTLVIVAPQAFTDGVEVVKPVILAHAKGHSDVGQMLSRNQIMECAGEDNYNIWVDSTKKKKGLPPPPASGHAVRESQSWCPPPRDYSFAWGCFHQLMETSPCSDVTYTALAGRQLNCATREIRITKLILVH